MGSPRSIRSRSAALAAILALSASLCACSAFEKCGLKGCPGDAKITADVQAAFSGHAELEPPNLINVQAVDGVVYLYGLVDTDFQRQMAESVAHQVRG